MTKFAIIFPQPNDEISDFSHDYQISLYFPDRLANFAFYLVTNWSIFACDRLMNFKLFLCDQLTNFVIFLSDQMTKFTTFSPAKCPQIFFNLSNFVMVSKANRPISLLHSATDWCNSQFFHLFLPATDRWILRFFTTTDWRILQFFFQRLNDEIYYIFPMIEGQLRLRGDQWVKNDRKKREKGLNLKNTDKKTNAKNTHISDPLRGMFYTTFPPLNPIKHCEF